MTSRSEDRMTHHSAASGAGDAVVMRWRPMSEMPAFEHRPQMQFIVVDGWQEHSGSTWHRRHWGLATIRHVDQPDCFHGYKREDIERIMRQDLMDGIDAVIAWMPARVPPFSDAALAATAEHGR